MLKKKKPATKRKSNKKPTTKKKVTTKKKDTKQPKFHTTGYAFESVNINGKSHAKLSKVVNGTVIDSRCFEGMDAIDIANNIVRNGIEAVANSKLSSKPKTIESTLF